MSDQEKRSRSIGMLSSIGIHVAILLLLFFTVAMTAPDPPIGDLGGAQLMLGYDDEGSGEIQPEEISNSVNNEEEKPAEQEEQKAEDVKPTEPEKTEETKQLTSEEESPVVVKEEKKKEVKPVPVTEEKKIVVPEKPVAEYKKEEKKEIKGDGTAKDGGKATASQGNDINKTGDKGNPEGTIKGEALYGKGTGGTGGDGLNLSMTGWAWDESPKIPTLPDNADGRVVFEIECDENGDIVGIITLERGLSAKAEQMLKDEIYKRSLRRTSSGKVPERSKGKVVFILKTQ